MKSKCYQSRLQGEIKIECHEASLQMVTKRLTLIPVNQLETTDIVRDCTQLFGDPKNVERYRDGQPWSAEKVETCITQEQDLWATRNGFGMFAVYNTANMQFMGVLCVEFAKEDFAAVGGGHSNAAELAYIIDKKFWGQGYGTEMAVAGKKYLRYLAEERLAAGLPLEFGEIVATVDPENPGSRRILEKTLKRYEPGCFPKFGSQRILFFKPLRLGGTDPCRSEFLQQEDPSLCSG